MIHRPRKVLPTRKTLPVALGGHPMAGTPGSHLQVVCTQRVTSRRGSLRSVARPLPLVGTVPPLDRRTR